MFCADRPEAEKNVRMTDSTLQAQTEAAIFYEEFFVPALFGQWTTHVADAANVRPGQRVLDVACGTGVLAREAARRVAPDGSVVGLDISPAMLSVAARISPQIEWREGNAQAIPFADQTFNAVVSQFGLMFFPDRPGALREMMRVLVPQGRLAVAVWDRLENIPAYSILVALLQHMVGRRAADALRTPFVLGDPERLQVIFAEAGIEGKLVTHAGMARYPSVRSWVLTDVKGWFPLVDIVLDKAEYDGLLAEAEHALHAFVKPNGTVEFPISIHVVAATRI